MKSRREMEYKPYYWVRFRELDAFNDPVIPVMFCLISVLCVALMLSGMWVREDESRLQAQLTRLLDFPPLILSFLHPLYFSWQTLFIHRSFNITCSIKGMLSIINHWDFVIKWIFSSSEVTCAVLFISIICSRCTPEFCQLSGLLTIITTK